MSVLLDDQMNSVIICLTTKSTWDDLILYHEGPSNVKESRVINLKLCYNTFKFKEGETLTQTFTRYKALMNELVNDGIKLSKLEINTGFINRLPKKWLSFCQSLRNTNHMKESELLYLVKSNMKKNSLIDFQDSPDDEEDTRSSQKYLTGLAEEHQERALLAKSKRFFKKGSQSPSQQKPELRPNKDVESKYNKVKAKLSLLSFGTSSKSSMVKNKGLVAESYKWDEEDVSSDDNEMTEVKVLMALVDDESIVVGKESARNREWVKISIKKVHTLLDMKDNDERKSFLDYLCIDLNYVGEKRSNLVLKHINLVQELNTCKEQLLVLKQEKLNFLTMHEQIPSQNKRILGLDQLTQDPSSSGQTNFVFVKSLTDDTKVCILGVERPWLSEAKGFTLPNHDTADEFSVCSTPLPLLEKLAGAETVFGPKTIKSILKSNSTFKAETVSLNLLSRTRKLGHSTMELRSLINNMANENVPAPRRFDEQILPFAAWVPIGKRNFVLDLQKK
ncbi:hypothetical protein Tco_0742669 [Tanacetum coccineum]